MTDLPAPFIERTRRLLGDDYPRFAEAHRIGISDKHTAQPFEKYSDRHDRRSGSLGSTWVLSLFPANVYLRPPASRRSLLRTRSGIDVPQSGNTAIRS